MNLVQTPVSVAVMFLLFTAAGCASKSVQTEPTPPPVAKKVVAEPVAIIEPAPKPEPIKIVEAKPAPMPPSQQRTVYFEYNSDELNSGSIEIITSHVDFLLKNPSYQITLEGHADERGSNDYNQKLGSLRAKAIKDVLISKGVSDEQVNLISYGEEKPAVMGNNDDAWQSNRRAIFVYSRINDISQSSSKASNKMFVSDQ